MTLGEAIDQADQEHLKFTVYTTRHLRVLNGWPILLFADYMRLVHVCPRKRKQAA